MHSDGSKRETLCESVLRPINWLVLVSAEAQEGLQFYRRLSCEHKDS